MSNVNLIAATVAVLLFLAGCNHPASPGRVEKAVPAVKAPLPNGPSQVLIGHTGYVPSIAISPDSAMLASGGNDQTVRLWELPSGHLQRTLASPGQRVHAVAFSPNGRLLASAGNAIRLWDAY